MAIVSVDGAAHVTRVVVTLPSRAEFAPVEGVLVVEAALVSGRDETPSP
jgi:hypothetical protein